MPTMKWTSDQDRRLAMLYAAGSTAAAIADEMGLAVSSVRTRVSTLGLLRRRTRSNPHGAGNMAWVIGPALASALPVPSESFAVDLLSKLTGGIEPSSDRPLV